MANKPKTKTVNAGGDEEQALFQQWLQAGLLPEVQPSLQPRSIKTAWTLIKAGGMILNNHSFDNLSIEDVCAKAGTTVGAFYGRFQNKQAFFVSMQRVVLLHAEMSLKVMMQEQQHRDLPLSEICFRMVESTVNRFRQNRGVVRASLQHAHEGSWDIFKEIGDLYRNSITKHLDRHLSHLPHTQRTLRLQFAHQSMIGTLVHVILTNPGAVNLDEDAMINELALMLSAYLKSE